MWELWQQLYLEWQVLVTQGKKGSHKPRRSRKVNFAKQNLHRGILSCSACGICLWKLKKPMCSSSFLYSRGRSHPLSLAPTGHPRLQKTGYLLIAQYLCYINFFGASKWTVSPSRACRKSAQTMILGCHRKSLRYIISASSAPIQANEPVAGFEKAW